MAPDLSEKLLGIDIDDADDRRRDADGADEEQEELEQFVVFGLGDYRFAVPVDAVRTLAEVPDEVTRVPRAPEAIEGMMDLRGEITAVIDPRVHFPDVDGGGRVGRERLLVLDRPADRQSAAIHVDDVIGVETVPESDVVDETTVDDRRLSGDALEHPLVVALLEQEHEPGPDVGSVVANRGDGAVTAADTEVGAGGSGALSATQGAAGSVDDPFGESLSLDGAESSGIGGEAAEPADTETETRTERNPDAESEPTREVVVEATPVVDVEKLLLASGRGE